LTCEHGGNRIPAAWRPLFRGQQRLLASHRGQDIGALECARHLARALNAPLFYSTVSRLLVDLNRSPGNRERFSRFTRELDAASRSRIDARYYFPHRDAVRRHVAGRVRAGARIVHIAVHSFTPVLDGKKRNADFGLLYDPRRGFETRTANALRQAMLELSPAWRVRRNYPYLGRADGFTTFLRRHFGVSRYAGIELEINQALCGATPAARRRTWRIAAQAIAATLRR